LGGFGETAFIWWEHCSVIAKTTECDQHGSSHESEAQQHVGCHGEVNFIPATPTTKVFRGLFQPVFLCDSMNLFLGEFSEDRTQRKKKQ